MCFPARSMSWPSGRDISGKATRLISAIADAMLPRRKMPRRFVLPICCLLSFAASGLAEPAEPQVTLHECGQRREPFSGFAASARNKVAKYFAEMGFELKVEDIASKVEVFCTSESARRMLATVFHAQDTDVPATFSGTVQKATLYVVSPEIYKENFTRLYGPDRWSDDEYEKLMTHEMIHSAHAIVATRLFGTEDGMGPQWLFEGMAIDASDQLPTSEDELNKITVDEFNKFLAAEDKGKVEAPVYIQYAKFYRYVRRFVSAKWIVENAGYPDINDRIRKALAPPH